ncbi:hypothetical protein EHE22_03655 [Ochrobactrum pseudogrignonense]|uniref:Uncharacterized protein n=1 Tax=Brucella pseudogrignonensis TaxID=419475 RepID=A0A7Y3WUS6_9HYPH|nr:hypothetical protein [Brucella pseudogrignonensis]NNV19525.1 hypothetical protein [Brucella pseudogrignonensis]
MAKFDYQRRAEADRIRRNGTDSINDFGLPGGLTPPRKRESKSDMRADLERMMSEYEKSGPAKGRDRS